MKKAYAKDKHGIAALSRAAPAPEDDVLPKAVNMMSLVPPDSSLFSFHDEI